MPKIIEQITEPNDIKKIDKKEYKKLADEIRHFLVEKISRTGGHLASNLGVIELTMALHLELTLPEDKIVWDVGHQAYTHKILTGRKEEFKTLRENGGLSGFPKRKESDCDAFDTGHSSTSISAALGMVVARDLESRQNKVVAVIGDGALSGGMAYEALNNAARLKTNFMIVLNDNNMSISENVGGMAAYLGKIRTNSKYQNLKDDVEQALSKLPKVGSKIVDKIRRSKDSIKRLMIPGMLFEDMGITYIGPIDGHNIEQLRTAFASAFQMKGAVIVHAITKKGKGYHLAEKNPADFHGVDPFYPKTGELRTKKEDVTYTEAFRNQLIKLAREDEKIVAITAAMPSGTGLIPFKQEFPKRFFDVGIAEEHAVTFAAGLAAEGIKPVFAVYSTFLQRSYDQIVHDVCIQKLPVVFAIDRSGIVGADGETHQGMFDISYLSNIPNLTIMAPKNQQELEDMLAFALNYKEPIAIRYPRGAAYQGLKEKRDPIVLGKAEYIYQEKEIALLAVGSMVKVAEGVHKKLKENKVDASVVNVRFVKPFDKTILLDLCKNHTILVTMEENVCTGGFGQMVSHYLAEERVTLMSHINISLPDEFIEHGNANVLLDRFGLSVEKITNKILEQLDKI